MKCGAVILAAGASSRLGEPKQLAVVGGERLLEHAVRTAHVAGCAPVVVVLGARAEEIERTCELGHARVLVNTGWAEGMASSIRLGVAALTGAVDAMVVMGCDQPAVTAEHLRVLMAGGDGAGVTASAYTGRRGIPACFAADCFEELLALKGDKGARDLLQAARAVELPGGELDVDTADALEEARARYG